MRQFGIIGYPLGHSFSEDFFSRKFKDEKLDCVYRNYEIDGIEQLPSLISKEKNLKGLNVTIPYKVSVMNFLDEIDQEALNTGAVNVIRISKISGKKILKGFNTDVFGFVESLKPLLRKDIKTALILGTGGSSRAVAAGLKKLEIEYQFVSRNTGKGRLDYVSLGREEIENNLLIINTTPLGMFPSNNSYPPIPYKWLNDRHIIFDLVYNPAETLFLRYASEKGALTKNGFEMLEIQALRSWKIWAGDIT